MILNKEQLLDNGGIKNREIKNIMLNALENSLIYTNPQKLVRNHFKINRNLLIVDKFEFNLDLIRNIFVIGGGKASGVMAVEINNILGDRNQRGVVNVPKGTAKNLNSGYIELNEASHPIPDENGIHGVKKMLKLIEDVNRNDLVICLISGGGSSLMTLPISDISISDIQQLTEMLLRSGASIDKLNIVRKHLSSIKGGRLAKKLYPAQVISLILSDVIGDPIQSIASGPTAPDNSTFFDVLDILKEFNLWNRCPLKIRQVISQGIENKIEETPKTGDVIFQNILNVIIGGNDNICESVEEYLKKAGFNSLILNNFLVGEAREVGSKFAVLALNIKKFNKPVKKPAAIIAGGETTVTLQSNGYGGRNQELGVSFAIEIDGLEGIVLSSLDTDGKDGNSDAAGSLVDGLTIKIGANKGLEAKNFLDKHDTYSFLSEVRGAIITGYTLTNVNDIVLMIIN